MHNIEAVEMMRRCSQEIKSLRKEIERLAPKATAYDSIAIILDLLPKRSIGIGEDICWTLDERINRINEELKADNK